MRWLTTAVRGVLALIVDDARLALAVLAWLALIGLVLLVLPAGARAALSGWIGALLFVGLAGILVRSATHAATHAAPRDAVHGATGSAGREPPALALRLDAASFPHPVTGLQCRETAISWVVLTGPYAYKIKKPLRLDFIDASTLERRRFLCEEELRLNRRFAPDLYEAVVPIGERDGHPEVESTRPPVEYAVRMRQFEGAQELAAQLSAGRVSSADMSAFGARLADWHAAAPVAQDPAYGEESLVRAQVLANFTALRPRLADAQAQRLQRLQDWAQAQLLSLAPLLVQRRIAGYVRECHGDLHAGNIVRWQGQWLAFDCLEFEPRLRWIDVFSDVSFLFMDLTSRGHADLAHAFLSGYCERGGDYQGLQLLRLYAVYRALVRAKVDALAVPEPVVDFAPDRAVSAERAPAEAAPSGAAPPGAAPAGQARSRLHARLQAAGQLALAHQPALLLMHGVTGSGKSWLSEQLIGALGAVRVRSDLERRRLLGSGAYTEAATDATYERLQACARSALLGGWRVIVDATLLQRARRLPFRQLARECACPVLLLACQAPEAVLQARVAQRTRTGTDPSEATAAVLARQLASREPFDDEERGEMIDVDTDAPQPLQRALSALRARLGAQAGVQSS